MELFSINVNIGQPAPVLGRPGFSTRPASGFITFVRFFNGLDLYTMPYNGWHNPADRFYQEVPMSQQQRRSKATTSAQEATTASAPAPVRRPRRRRIEFLANVRFTDGRTQMFEVSNAQDPLEAREMVYAELTDVAAVVVVQK